MQKYSPINSLVIDYGGTWVRFSLNGTRFAKFPSLPLDQIPSLISSVLRKWKIRQLDRLKIGAKGVWSKSEKKQLTVKLKNLAHEIEVLSDVELAYDSTFGNKSGILLIAGTGSIAFGKNSYGKKARAGGLGPKSGDEGSGYWIGKQYLQRKLKQPAGVKSARETASIAKIVINKSKAKDTLERKIILEAQEHLAKLVVKVFQKLELEKSVTAALAGGLFKNNSFKNELIRVLRKKLGAGLRFRTANAAL